MAEQSQVTIRASGSLIGAQVMLDGIEVATMTGGEVVTFPVSAGAHSLQIQQPWYSSNRERFSLGPGERIEFECGTTFWHDWMKSKSYFWWARPFSELAILRPHLTKVKTSR